MLMNRPTTPVVVAMGGMWLPVLVFWAPLLLGVPLGLLLTFGRGSSLVRRSGPAVVAVSVAMVLGAPFTLASTRPETAVGHLALGVLGPSLLMGSGTLLATFGGQAPVGRLPGWTRHVGFGLVVGGALWLLLLTFVWPPSLAEQHNAFWGIYLTSLFASMATLAGLGVVFTLIMGAERHREAVVLGLVSGGALVALLAMLISGAPTLDASAVRFELWGAMADLGGWTVGLTVGVVWYAWVVYRIERTLPEPPTAPPLDAAQMTEARRRVERGLAETTRRG